MTMFCRISVVLMGVLSGSALLAGDANWRGWPARSFVDMKKSGEPVFIYLKDPMKNNKVAGAFESKDLLDHDAVKSVLPKFTSTKLATNDKFAPTFPPEWVERAQKQAIVVVASADLTKVAVFDAKNKNPKSIADAAEMILKYQADRKKEAAEKRAKEEAERKAKFAAEVKENSANVPGLEIKAAPKKGADKNTKKNGAEPEEE